MTTDGKSQGAPRYRPAPVTMYGLVHPAAGPGHVDPRFPDAPDGWTEAEAAALAAKDGLTLGEDHWEAIRVLQGSYKDEASPRIRLLHQALEARFGAKGGSKYLYGLFPGGPIVQGCALAGLRPPAGARDKSFGSVA